MVALVPVVVLACQRRAEVARPTGPISTWKIPEKWSIGPGTQDGRPIFTRFNAGLKPYAGRPEFSHQLGIAVPLKNPTPDGLPTQAEAEQLNQIEDEMGRLLLAGNESLLAGVITTNGMREFVLYTSDPAAAMAKAADLARRVHHHEVQFVMNDDPEWKAFSRFRPGA
jgi:hypothetical protein